VRLFKRLAGHTSHDGHYASRRLLVTVISDMTDGSAPCSAADSQFKHIADWWIRHSPLLWSWVTEWVEPTPAGRQHMHWSRNYLGILL